MVQSPTKAVFFGAQATNARNTANPTAQTAFFWGQPVYFLMQSSGLQAIDCRVTALQTKVGPPFALSG